MMGINLGPLQDSDSLAQTGRPEGITLEQRLRLLGTIRINQPQTSGGFRGYGVFHRPGDLDSVAIVRQELQVFLP
jgi:hypothetical protein